MAPEAYALSRDNMALSPSTAKVSPDSRATRDVRSAGMWRIVATFAICHPQEKGPMWPKMSIEVHPARTVGAGRTLQVASRGFGTCKQEEGAPEGTTKLRAASVPLSLSLKVQQAL